MKHEDYKVFADRKKEIENILSILEAFDPITGRALSEEGIREDSVLSQDEKAALPSYVRLNKQMLDS